jgi:hypothetical protein
MSMDQSLDFQALPQATVFLLLQPHLPHQSEFIQAHLPCLAHLTRYLQVCHLTPDFSLPLTNLSRLAHLTSFIPLLLTHLTNLVHL